MKRHSRIYLFILIALVCGVVFFPATAMAVRQVGFETTPYDRTTDMDFIDDVTLEDALGNDLTDPGNTNIAIDSDVTLTYYFSIDNTEDVIAGDTFLLDIPVEILVANPGVFQLTMDNPDFNSGLPEDPVTNPATIVVADYTLATDGTILFTFTNEIHDRSLAEVTGYFWFYLQFDPDNLGLGGGTTITFDIGVVSPPEEIIVEFEEIEPPPATIEKSGTLVSGSQSIIRWTITVNDDPVRTTDASVVDVLPSNLTFIDGHVTINGAPADSADYTIVGQTFTYTFPSTINDTQVITFWTEVTDATFATGTEDGDVTLSNQSELHHDGGEVTVSNSATVDVPVDYIDKSGSHDLTDHTISWTVWINNNSVYIPNAVFQDSLAGMPAELTLDTSTFMVDDVAVDPADLVYDTGTDLITYTFPAPISQPTKITFVTQVDESYYSDNRYQRFENTAYILGDNVPADASGTDNPGVTAELINKLNNQGYNTSNGYITWRIRINRSQTTLTDPVITDQIPDGLEYVTGSATINNGASDSYFTYVEDTDSSSGYTGTLTYDFDPSSTTDTITDEYTITFYTRVTNPEIYANNAFIDNWRNEATLTLDGGTQITDPGTQDVNSEVISKTGTDYDYTTRVITWRIVVNDNEYPLENVVVTDNIPSGMVYVPGSFSINNGASMDGFLYATDPDPATSGFSGTWEYEFDPLGTTDVISGTYVITFQTTLTDTSVFATNGDKVFTNDAALTHNDLPHAVNTTGSQTVTNEVIVKDGTYVAGNTFIDWEIKVNMNQIELTDPVISDVFQDGLQLDTATVHLYYMDVTPDGQTSAGAEITPLTSENVVYDVDTNAFELHIPNPPVGLTVYGYVLTFTTFVTDQTQSPFSNTATFQGTGSTENDAIIPIRVAWAGAGNAVVGENGTITVQKEDADDNSRLNGAEFILIDRYGNTVSRITTSGNGELIFDHLKYDIPYTVQETEAPTGYVVNSTPYTFIIDSASMVYDIVYTHENERIRGSVELYKYDDTMNGLGGAVFTCYDSGGAVVTTATTDSNGRAVFNDLEYGDYTFVETTPPVGYLPNTAVLSATIVTDGATIPTSPAFITDSQIIGSITLRKVEATALGPLADAEIGLFSQSDTSFSSPIAVVMSNVQGIVFFDQIPYGTYVIKEVVPPDGYALSDETILVNITTHGLTVDAGELVNEYDGSTSPSTGDDMGVSFLWFYLTSGLFVLLVALQFVLLHLEKHPKRMIGKYNS
ncbi:MAG: SpaA isopeptide-forming pilin-related protein [Eubacteriales bacterium]